MKVAHESQERLGDSRASLQDEYVGSEVSDAYPPIQGMYAAKKHAVKGYTTQVAGQTHGAGGREPR